MIRGTCIRVVLALLLAACLPLSGEACTGLFLKAEDGGVVYARSLEFATPLKSQLLVIPRGTSCQPQLPGGAKGRAWKTKYGIVGMNALGMRHVVDGMNEKGLQFGVFWFPGFSEYAKFDPAKASSTLTPWDMGEWLLGQFATVEEARNKLKGMRMVAEYNEALGTIPTAHFLLVDATGDSLVIEPIGGKLVLREDPVGVFTNSPSFDWHMTNLRNYPGLSSMQPKSAGLGQQKITALGMGAGMLGLPGDITPPSRFVRAAFYLNSLTPLKTTQDALASIMRFHQTFFITRGMARQGDGDTGPEEITQWQVYTDLKNRKLYFSTYDNLTPRMVDVARLDFAPGAVRTLPIDQPGKYEDLTSSFK